MSIHVYIHIIHILHTYSINHLVYHLKQLGCTGLYPGKNHIQTRMHMVFSDWLCVKTMVITLMNPFPDSN